ncbi:MAG: DUF115 domain-containing protein [Desulfovibrionaceae bacterium]|nr:DUF115 domain-containing protein [Desulfovibrionaceae bacterium]
MKSYPFLKANIEALETYCPDFYRWLSNRDIDRAALAQNIFQNRLGLIDWRMPSGQGLFEAVPPGPVYSKWTPEDQAHTSATIIVGCNLGYGVNHVLVNTPDSHKVIVIEPRPELVLACLGQTDYRPFFANKKLHFAPPDEEYISKVVRCLDLQLVYGRVHLRGDLPSQQMGPEYAQWAHAVRRRIENFHVELITLRFRQDTMVGNELKNFHRAQADGSLLPLRDSALGLGAVIIGAGPSLKDNGPALAKNPGYALYACALQTVPAARAAGLSPDLCLALDYDHSMLKVYDRLDLDLAKDVPLIYSTKVNPEVVERYPGPTLPLWTVGGMATFAMNQNEFVMDAGGNVSLTLVRFLRWCGVSHLLLVGQDFAWNQGVTHAEGHHSYASEVQFEPGRHRMIKNRAGQEVMTSIQYLTAKRELEDDVAKHRLPVYNLYGGGADIRGAAAVDLAEARRKGLLSSVPGSLEGFMKRLAEARRPRPRLSFEPKSALWTSALRGLEKRLERLFKKVGANQNEIHALMDRAQAFIQQDPLYLPYLFNETVDLSGLTKAKRRYELRDLSEFKKISRKVLKKVREMDRSLARVGPGHRAA